MFLGAYVVGLVGRERLVAANGRLEVNRTIGFSAGPAIAGQLVQWVGAAFATIGTALGFQWSAVWLVRIRPIRVSALRGRGVQASLGHAGRVPTNLRPPASWATSVRVLATSGGSHLPE